MFVLWEAARAAYLEGTHTHTKRTRRKDPAAGSIWTRDLRAVRWHCTTLLPRNNYNIWLFLVSLAETWTDAVEPNYFNSCLLWRLLLWLLCFYYCHFGLKFLSRGWLSQFSQQRCQETFVEKKKRGIWQTEKLSMSKSKPRFLPGGLQHTFWPK